MIDHLRLVGPGASLGTLAACLSSPKSCGTAPRAPAGQAPTATLTLDAYRRIKAELEELTTTRPRAHHREDQGGPRARRPQGERRVPRCQGRARADGVARSASSSTCSAIPRSSRRRPTPTRSRPACSSRSGPSTRTIPTTRPTCSPSTPRRRRPEPARSRRRRRSAPRLIGVGARAGGRLRGSRRHGSIRRRRVRAVRGVTREPVWYGPVTTGDRRNGVSGPRSRAIASARARGAAGTRHARPAQERERGRRCDAAAARLALPGDPRVPDLDGGASLAAHAAVAGVHRAHRLADRRGQLARRGLAPASSAACSTSSTARSRVTAASEGRSGAFMDSVLDRVSDMILFSCLFWNLASQGETVQAALALLTLIVSLGVSQIRAEAEAVGIELTEGLVPAARAHARAHDRPADPRHDVPGADRARGARRVHRGAARVHRAVAGLTDEEETTDGFRAGRRARRDPRGRDAGLRHRRPAA